MSSELRAVSTPTTVRYRVLLLTFVTAMIMYIDRTAMGTVTPYMREEFGIDITRMGWAVSSFNWAYAIFQVPGGWMTDRYGARVVLAAAMAAWSVFTFGTGLTAGLLSLVVVRFLFGMGEAAAFPAASRALVRWLPAGQRAFGQGFQHAGSRFGAAITPPLVLAITVTLGWRSVFYIFGVCGLLWAAIWYVFYRNEPAEHPNVNSEELTILAEARIPAVSQASIHVPWRQILRDRNVWFLSTMYFCYGWVLWIYLQWFPTYLRDVWNLSAKEIAVAASIPLFAATVTNALGGWMSDRVTRQLNDLRRGRLLVSVIGFVIAGGAILPGVMAPNVYMSIACFTIALAGLELTVAVSWAICIDIAGNVSGSVSGVMNTLGNLGGGASSVIVTYLAKYFGWTCVFLVASVMCLTAALLARQIQPGRALHIAPGK